MKINIVQIGWNGRKENNRYKCSELCESLVDEQFIAAEGNTYKVCWYQIYFIRKKEINLTIWGIKRKKEGLKHRSKKLIILRYSIFIKKKSTEFAHATVRETYVGREIMK